ncbi:TPA: N-acetylmuramoyl-L-alanine amidase [Providencia rettgeri]|uniref:N-acetylmuramoyl-L-alanine amidase n=1 Tax=Providencia TaxID=586 RepID=UPI001B37C90C|nr:MULTISPECIES: N-acetylmuramoyl-L-alanine amidase [Providencia]EMB5787398.1 N-acetylmuramoyl-L-alanine amidase [Providencia rettgeri]MBQ0367815.1 N-acetylmuramoyl-L-alanine amidase [Providencia rettgeri]MDK7746817.1 N-acetylmuramoyl-L-alanine amidase [Providencia rettgeri]MDK7759557.1 N-acetylmuramoyl-L-alanine amidase [Providencia rettgeri]HBC7431607.1 N-acetylmuramoyl-L-alanine amidase [Providencia rettgeri]
MFKYIGILFTFLLLGCSASNKGYYLDNRYPSKNSSQRIQYVIIHYTVSDDAHSIVTLTQGKVSSHYLIPSVPETKNGRPVVLQLVPESLKSWHAGESYWLQHNGLNDTSIGIEIVNAGLQKDVKGKRYWAPYNEAQITALIPLLQDIMKRYSIPPENIIGHSDIAPLRKQDPGKAFPWQRLAQHGIGAWPDPKTVTKFLAGRNANEPASVLHIQKALHFYGYSTIPLSGQLDSQTKKTLRAFQLHFRPRDIEGQADAETEAIALALIEKYRDMQKFKLFEKTSLLPNVSTNQQGD